MNNNWKKYVLSDEEYKKEYGDDEEDPREVLKEETEFFRKNWFNYLTAAALSFTIVAGVVAAFLTVMSFIYN